MIRNPEERRPINGPSSTPRVVVEPVPTPKMASNTRSGRRPPQNQISISALSTLERLLLAQAVYEFGASAWPSVAKLLSRHPLMSLRPKTFFTAQVSSKCTLLRSKLGLRCGPVVPYALYPNARGGGAN